MVRQTLSAAVGSDLIEGMALPVREAWSAVPIPTIIKEYPASANLADDSQGRQASCLRLR